MDENKRDQITDNNEVMQSQQNTSQEYNAQTGYGMQTGYNVQSGYDVQPGYGAYTSVTDSGNQNNNVNGMTAWYTSQQMGQSYQNTTQNIYQDENPKQHIEVKQKDNNSSDKKKKDNDNKGNKKPGFGIKLLQVAAAAVVFGLVAGAAFQGVRLGTDRLTNRNSETEKTTEASAVVENTTEADTTDKPYVEASSKQTTDTVYDVADVAEKVMPSIVSITGTYVTTYDYWFDSYESETPGAGSGIIIGKDENYLYVLTNYHVVEDAKELSVSFVDDKTADAAVKGYDEQHDTAIVLVDLKDIEDDTLKQIKEIQVGSSDELRVGDPCIAIGNALGYGQSVTVGYISALDRELSVSDGVVTVIQTDAAINPGNSGGALVNMNGELVGMNTAKYVDSKVEGMGYALPISDIQDIINELIESDSKTPTDVQSGDAYLGISAQTITDEYSELLGMPQGVYISSVEEGSAAEECGLQSGDVICGFDGKEVSDMETLHDMVVSHKPGDEVQVEYYRNNNGNYTKKSVKATLQEKK
ncbi:MAG: S1C family serine protease [Coprococcus sp.]